MSDCAIGQDEPVRCGLAWAAKVVASDWQVNGRDPHDTLKNSMAWAFNAPEAIAAAVRSRDLAPLVAGVEIAVDAAQRSVRVSRDGLSAMARWTGPQGAMVVPDADAPLHFLPRPVLYRGPAADAAWPAGDADALALPADPSLMARAVDLYFADPAQQTQALVVVHRGCIVAEHYRSPFGPETRFQSWSMGKTIAAVLVAIAVQRGWLALDQDNLFPEWQQDARRHIRLAHLLNMASGLQFTGDFGRASTQKAKWGEGLFHDHTYVYAGGIDAAGFCLAKPLEHPPGSHGRYRNCDPLLALLAVRRAAEARGEDFLDWPQRALFDPLGMAGMLLETDRFGHFLISGHDYGRARDWARLGLFLLAGGVVDGEQLASRAMIDFMAAASSTDPHYGGFLYRNAARIDEPGLPEDTCWASGGGGQRTHIIPSLDLVIVRLGHVMGDGFGRAATMARANGLIARAVTG